MKRLLLSMITLIVLLSGLQLSAFGWNFTPLEIVDPPVNGTDRTEDPAALRGYYGFGDRASKKMVEHGGTTALLDEIDALETPHIDWINAYSEGPVRVLWVASPRYDLRGAVEIRHRSDFEITYLMIPPSLVVHHNDKAMNDYFSKRYDELLSRDYDVIVMRHYAPRMYRDDKLHPTTSRVYERIEEKVRNGTGLICLLANSRWHRGPDGGNQSIPADNESYARLAPLYYSGRRGMQAIERVPERTDAASPVSDGISFAAWPYSWITESTADADATVLATADGHPLAATGRLGKGRVVGFHYQTELTGQVGLVPEFDSETHPMYGDYYEAVYAAWLRALAWAAGKPPRIGLQAPDVTSCASGAKPDLTVTLQGGGDKAQETVTLRYRLIDAFGDSSYAGEQPVALAGGIASVTPELPVLHANGFYRLDMWVEADGKTYNWGTAGIRVEGGPQLSVTQLDPTLRPGDTVQYRVDTDGAQGDLAVLAVDGNDRVFYQTVASVTNGATVQVETSLSQLPANRVFFTLHAAGSDTVLGRCAKRFYLPRIGLDSLDGRFLIASYGPTDVAQHLSPIVGLLYRAAGIDGYYWNNHARIRLQRSADAGLFSIGGKSWQFKQNGFAKVHKWTPNDPANREKLKAHIADDVKDFEAFGSISRVLDDETWFAYTGLKDGEMQGAQLTQDRWTLDMFRAEMKKRYGTIAALNDMWGTEFASFDDVRVIEESEIKDSDNPSGWLEFREYMNWTYAVRYYGWVSEQHEKLLGDDYRTGCGAPNWTTSEGGPVYRGGDPGRMSGHMRFMMLYGGGSPGYAYAGQPGGQKYDPPMVWRDYGAWTHLLTGADALWYYFGNAIIGSELAWRRHAVWLNEGIDDIQRGCGILVSGAQRDDVSVRVLSTSQNQHMGWLFAKRSDDWNALRLAGGQPTSARTFRGALGNMFVGAGDISEESLAAGELDGCKLLFLPQQVNLSDEAVAAIRAYVESGGIVMADIMPATRHQMGKPRGNSALADVFGIDFSGARIHKENESWYSVGIKSPEDADRVFSHEFIWLPNRLTFYGLEATTAVPHAAILSKQGKEAPGFFVNNYGKGRAVLFNFVYSQLNDETLDWHKQFARSLLAWAEIEPSARIVDPVTHEPLPYRPLHTFRRGKALLLGSIRGSFMGGGRPVLFDRGRMFSLDDEAKFIWETAQHAYDVRGGRYLGFGTSATIDLPSYRGRLLCLLPYKVESVALEAPAGVEPGRIVTLTATVTTDGEAAGEHVLYFDVVSPTGARRPLYCKTRVAPEGRASFDIPFALNDHPGEWTVTARDVMTGVEAKALLNLPEQTR